MARVVKRIASLLCFLACIGGGAARAQSLPDLKAPVNDFAHVFDSGTAAELDKRIRALQAASGDVVVVATVDTFAPFGSIEEYAAKLFEKAGIGERGKDNGALVVLAVADRRVRIEVGYGLEEFITDGFSGDTIRQFMLPAFRQSDYGRGLLDGTTNVIQRIAERRGVTLQNVPRQNVRRERQLPLSFIIFAFILFFIVMGRIRRAVGGSAFRRGGMHGSTWSGWSGGGGSFGGGFGGGGGGGFGGFGGGHSGGGGGSGGW